MFRGVEMSGRRPNRLWLPSPSRVFSRLSEPIRGVLGSTRLILRKSVLHRLADSASGNGHPPLTIRSGSRSICGDFRQKNEDHCFMNDSGQLLVVADGMGGHHGGARASKIVASACANELAPLVGEHNIDDCVLQARIHRCVQHARDEMIQWVSDNPVDEQMGTTLAVAMVIGQRLYVANVGDSRVYLFHRGHLRQLTVDETLAQALVEAGAMTPENASNSQYRHMLMNCVGVREIEHLPDVRSYPLEVHDRLVLGTDGFTEYVSEHEIAEVLESYACPQFAADKLVELAVANQSTDNVTVIVADVVREPTLDPLAVEYGNETYSWESMPVATAGSVACSSSK